MAITLKKKIAAPKKEAVEVKDLVDQFDENWREMSKLVLQMKKISDKMVPLKVTEKALLQQITDANLDKGDDEEFSVEGSRIALDFGKKGSERKITDIRYIQKRMGNDVFYELAKVNLGDVDKYLTQAERDKCIETSRTARSYKVRQK